MKKSVVVLVCAIFMAGAAYGQQTGDEASDGPVEKGDAFKIEGHLLELIKKKISEEEYKKVQKDLDGKELTQMQLLDKLQELKVEPEEIQTIITEAKPPAPGADVRSRKPFIYVSLQSGPNKGFSGVMRNILNRNNMEFECSDISDILTQIPDNSIDMVFEEYWLYLYRNG